MSLQLVEETGAFQSSNDSLRVLQTVSRFLILECTRLTKEGVSIYLPKLGFIIPTQHQSSKLHTSNSKIYLRQEITRSIEFEKCDDALHSPYKRSKDYVEITSLADKVHARLQLKDQVWLSKLEVERLIQELIQHLKEQLLHDGLSPFLGKLGHLVALHNRQGKDINDWYAGADIFITNTPKWLVSVLSCKQIEHPILEYSWEPYEAYFNLKPASVVEVENLKFAVFKRTHPEREDQFILTYVSDGYRNLTNLADTKTDPVELVFELLTPNPDAPISSWPLDLLKRLTKSWDRISKCIDLKEALALGSDIELNALLITPNNLFPYEFISQSGSFIFRTITGITDDEALFANKNSPELLQAVLERRGLGNITKTTRGSVFRRSFMVGVS